MNKNKQFLKEELIRYEEQLNQETPGTEEYETIMEKYLNIYKVLYPFKNVLGEVLKLVGVVGGIGSSIFLGIYSYRKNQDLESKDGDTWREAHEVKRTR